LRSSALASAAAARQRGGGLASEAHFRRPGLPHARFAPHRRCWRLQLPGVVLHADDDAATTGTRRPLRSVRHAAAAASPVVVDGDGFRLLPPRILTHLPIGCCAVVRWFGWLVDVVRGVH
jgi:hypothetical protein